MSDNVEYQMKISKAMLAGLGYKERETAPILQDRLMERAKKFELSVENHGTMFFKPTETTAHLVTFATVGEEGAKVPFVYSVFGEVVDGKLRLEPPEKATMLALGDFNFMTQFKEPFLFMRLPAPGQQAQPTPQAAASPVAEPPVTPSHIEEAMARTFRNQAVSQMAEEVLKNYPVGIPLDKCNA